MSEHRELIEQAREWHTESELRAGWCRACLLQDWPCLVARLAVALEQGSARASELDQQLHQERLEASAICLDWAEKLDVAQARAERLAGKLERERRETSRLRDALGWDPEDPSDNADLLGSAALGLVDGGESDG